MTIGGFQKVSLIDYPGKIAAIIFTVGCNFKCGYCHNRELNCVEGVNKISEDEILSFLEKRKGKLEGVVITGGEPTLQKDLEIFIRKIKEMGYLVKLDTNGSNPQIIENLIRAELLDFIAMDIKAPFYKYQKIANTKIISLSIKKSISLIINSKIKHEFRSTVVKNELRAEDLILMAKMIKGASVYALQKFNPSKVLDKSFHDKKTYPVEDFESIKNKLSVFVKDIIIR